MKRHFFLTIIGVLACGFCHASLSVTKTTCNYQSGDAVVKRTIMVGWQMSSTIHNDVQTAYQIEIKERITGKTIYQGDKVSSPESQHISLPPLTENKFGYQWRVRVWDGNGQPSAWSDPQTIYVAPQAIDAQWIGAISKADAKIPTGRWSNADFRKDVFKDAWADVDTLSAKSIILRKNLKTSRRKILNAMVYICGLGHYELSVNGKKIGDSEFAPLWSDYDKTVYYQLYDVTPYIIRNARNAIHVLLGNGMFNVQRLGRYTKLQTSFGAPKLMFKMIVNYSDGSQQILRSDDSWKWTFSPITYNCIYGGESYDARQEQPSAYYGDFEDKDWNDAAIVEAPSGKLCVQTAPPVKIMEHYDIKSWRKIPADSLAVVSDKMKRTVDATAFVADMGQNLAGFPEICVSGKAGQTITLFVGERLFPEGCVDQRMTGRQHYYEYTLKGDRMEVWHPRFSYYGFRYIQVEGAVLEGQPNPQDLPVLHQLKSCFVYNSAPEGSSFECSNDLFTKTHRLIERAERSNMQAVLTDCPHREKLGWLEQDHLNGPSLFYNYDMTTYIPKVIQDIVDSQKDDGMVPTTAPQYCSFGNLFDDSPEWGSALVILPFMYYEHYGDSSLIVNHYQAMKRYVDYLTSRSEDGIVSHGLGDWYDYGPGPAGFSRNTPIPLVATAHYIFDLQLLQKAAEMTGNTTDKMKYRQLTDKVIDSFNNHFFHADSCYYGNNSQASNALPLFLGITRENEKGVLSNLINDIHQHGNRITTGDISNRYLFQTLARYGYDALMYTMFNHDEAPGYGCQLKYDATTLTEQWDPHYGNSWNHFMLGQIDEWLFKSMAGIRQQPGTVGMRHLLISPQLAGDLKSVKASTECLYGKISVVVEDGKITVSLPVGCDARVKTGKGWQEMGSGTTTADFPLP